MKMELMLFVVITTIILSFSMFKPCTSLHIQFQNTFPQDAAAAPDHQLPRKLIRLMEQMTTKIKPSNIEDDQQMQYSYHEGRKQLIIKGKFMDHMKTRKARVKVETWKDWVERKNHTTSSDEEIFTMDYSRVTRRRPIHNKGLPVSP